MSAQSPKLVRGTIRGDGMIFWCYDHSCPRGELWVSGEKFAEKMKAHRDRARKYYHNNPEKFRAAARDWCRNNTEIARQRKRAYYHKNADTIRAKMREYHARNTERAAAYKRAYYLLNKDEINRKNREHAATNRDACRDRYLRRNFGIGLSDYNRMSLEQGGVCAVCKRPERAVKRGRPVCLSVDHCHKTGAVRGLLCTSCNIAIGHLGDSAASAIAVAAYLDKHQSKAA